LFAARQRAVEQHLPFSELVGHAGDHAAVVDFEIFGREPAVWLV